MPARGISDNFSFIIPSQGSATIALEAYGLVCYSPVGSSKFREIPRAAARDVARLVTVESAR